MTPSPLQAPLRRLSCAGLFAACFALTAVLPARAGDPLASNNGFLPQAWNGPFKLANLDYPETGELPARKLFLADAPLTVQTAADYAEGLKQFLAPDLRGLVEDGIRWDARQVNWYDMVWSGEAASGPAGMDPTSGREPLMNSYAGQIVPPETFALGHRPDTFVQNHAVIAYNATAAEHLGEVWDNVYDPNIGLLDYPSGSIMVKVEAVTNTPQNWSLVQGSAIWPVYRPRTEDQARNVTPLVPQILPVRPFQMAIKVKDPVAAPGSGWVWLAYVYDYKAPGKLPWDRFVPVGVQWGNDPGLTGAPSGLPHGQTLRETWINPMAPDFARDTLGWGGRLAGPMDVATRHNVVTPSGRRYTREDDLSVSSCQSCHSAAEHPFSANLYPAPNRAFPRDGEQFLLYEPGSPQWARWFQNRPGTDPISENIGGQGLEYDMVLMFALSAYNAAVGDKGLVRKRLNVH